MSVKTSNPIPMAALCLLLTPFLAVGCGSNGATNSGGNGGAIEPARAKEVVSDSVGQEPVRGIVKIAEIDTSALNTAGTVTYTVDNISGAVQEDLSWSVLFMYPPRAQGGLTQPFDSDVTVRKELVLTEGKRDKLKAVSREFAARSQRGETVLATRLLVNVAEKTSLVAREPNGTPGTLVLNRQLECVGLADNLFASPPTMQMEFENVTGQPVPASEVKVVFLRGLEGRTVAETGWYPFQELNPGQRGRLVPDLSGVGKVRNLRYLVKVRLASDW